MQKHKYLLKKSPEDDRHFVHALLSTEDTKHLPSQIDLESVLPSILDQKNLGVCALCATSNLLKYLLMKEKHTVFQPSRLYLYWNTRVSIERSPPNEDTGVAIADVCKALTKYHVCDEDIWPYIIDNFSILPPLEAYKNANLHKQLVYKKVPQNINNIKNVLVSGYPIIFGIQIFNSFETEEVMKTGIVPIPNKKNDSLLGGHAILLVGYNDETKKFKIMNSWGSEVGQKGYFELDYDYVLDKDLASDFWTITFFS